MSLDASFVNALFTKMEGYVEAARRPERIEFNPETDYLDKPVVLPPKPPMAETLKLATLDGIVAMSKATPGAIVTVDGPDEVSLRGPIVGRHRLRETFATAVFAPPEVPGFKLDGYIPLESMVIGLQAMFVATPELGTLLKLLGNIVGQKVKTVVDNGIAQAVEARTGVASREEVVLEPGIMLAGLRTFPEVAQPASRYVVRLKNGLGDDGLPMAALFRADGGDWVLQAIVGIREYLQDKLGASAAVIA